MSRAAPRAGVPPLRLSYRHALLALRAFWQTAWLTPPGVDWKVDPKKLDPKTKMVMPGLSPDDVEKVRMFLWEVSLRDALAKHKLAGATPVTRSRAVAE